jgi:all-trans-retinol 13,14-reductase
MKALVIGSGISGLTIAVLLAEHGWSVTVLEAHAIPGGLMQRFRRGPYWFDTGFHFITGSSPGSIFPRLAARLGILDHIRMLPLDEAAQFRIHIPGEEHFDLPVGLAASEGALQARWPEQAEPIARFFAAVRACMADTKWLSCLIPADTPGGAEHQVSVAAVLDRCGVSGRAKEVIGCLTGILAMHAETCPLELYAGFAGTALDGSYRAEGGGEAIIKPLVKRFAELGGTLLTNRAAARIHFTDRDITSVDDVKGVAHQADLYIATCHPSELLRLTGPGGMRPALEERVRDTPDSDSAVLVYAALNKAPTSLGRRHHFARLGRADDFYYLSPSNFHEHAVEHPYLEAMLWVPCDSVRAWRGTAKGKRPEDYEAWKRDREMEILNCLVSLHPELAGTIGRVWSSTPLSVEHYVRSRNGAAMGLSHDIGHLGTEPVPRRNRLKNLLFSGQNVGHPGVVGCMISSFILAEMVLAKDLRSEVMAQVAPTR